MLSGAQHNMSEVSSIVLCTVYKKICSICSEQYAKSMLNCVQHNMSKLSSVVLCTLCSRYPHWCCVQYTHKNVQYAPSSMLRVWSTVFSTICQTYPHWYSAQCVQGILTGAVYSILRVSPTVFCITCSKCNQWCSAQRVQGILTGAMHSMLKVSPIVFCIACSKYNQWCSAQYAQRIRQALCTVISDCPQGVVYSTTISKCPGRWIRHVPHGCPHPRNYFHMNEQSFSSFLYIITRISIGLWTVCTEIYTACCLKLKWVITDEKSNAQNVSKRQLNWTHEYKEQWRKV